MKMPRPVPEFKGELITMRPLDPDRDAGAYYQMFLEPDMHTWTGNRPFKSIREARLELDRYAAMDDYSFWMIDDNQSGRLAGRFFITLSERDGLLVAGQATRIAKPFWRKGHNRQARSLIVPYVFNVLKADLIETEAWAGNVNSTRSLESFGFQFRRSETRWNEKHRADLQVNWYVMTRDHWLRRIA